MSDGTVVFDEFTVERLFAAPVSKLYQMFADQKSKELWFKGPNDEETKHTMDFRVGGSEYSSGKFHDGLTHVFKATYYDIVTDKRIVYSYEMYLDNKRISVSLTTIQFEAQAELTRLTIHESGAFLDGLDKPSNREYGSGLLFDALEKALLINEN